MANEIYDSSWWGNTIQTASSIGTSTEMIQGQFNLTKLGDELVTNGNFSNGLTDWVVDDGTSWTNVNNTAFCDGNNGLIKQNIASAHNKIYKVTFDTEATNTSDKELGVRIDGGAYAFGLYSTGTHTIYLTAGSSSIEGVLFYALNGWTGSIDNVSVKEARAEKVEAVKCLADAIHRIGIQDIQN